MYYSPYATSVTRKHVAGFRLNDIEPDPNNYKPKGSTGDCTKPARHREGIGNVPKGASNSMGNRIRDMSKYPGGRHLRRALKNLHQRRDGEQGAGHCQPDCHRGSQVNYATVPGSMKA